MANKLCIFQSKRIIFLEDLLQKMHLVRENFLLFANNFSCCCKWNTQLDAAALRDFLVSSWNACLILATSSILIKVRPDPVLWATFPCSCNSWNQPLKEFADSAEDRYSLTYNLQTAATDFNFISFSKHSAFSCIGQVVSKILCSGGYLVTLSSILFLF